MAIRMLGSDGFTVNKLVGNFIEKKPWVINNAARVCVCVCVCVSGFPLAFAMSPLANQTKNWRNGICVFSPIWRNQLNDNSIPMEKHFDCFH